MYEKDLNYCPECKDEYREEISVCAACNVGLVSGEQMLRQADMSSREKLVKAVIKTDDDLLPLQKGNLLDMKRIKNLLAEHNIPAMLIKDEHCRSGCCGGVEVSLQIRLNDRERAAVILEEEYERTTGVKVNQDGDEENIFSQDSSLVICPACGRSFTPSGPDCPDCGLCFI